MANQEKNCYLGINGKKYGPVSEQDIQTLYAQKKITGDTKFARAGAKEWIPLSKSGVIAPGAVDDGVPPLPPESKPAKMSTGKKIAAVFGGLVGFIILIPVIAAVMGSGGTTPQKTSNVQTNAVIPSSTPTPQNTPSKQANAETPTPTPEINYGSYTFNNGSIYEGDLVNGIPHGYGTVLFISGDIYEGEWKDGLPMGQGTITYKNGTVYEGGVKNALHHGYGVETHPNGDRFEGNYKDGLADGAGTYYYANGDVFEGEYKDGKPISGIITEAQSSNSGSSGGSATDKERADTLAIQLAKALFKDYTGNEPSDEAFIDDSDDYYRYRVKVYSGDKFYFVHFRLSQDLKQYEHNDYPLYQQKFDIDDKGIKPDDWVD